MNANAYIDSEGYKYFVVNVMNSYWAINRLATGNFVEYWWLSTKHPELDCFFGTKEKAFSTLKECAEKNNWKPVEEG